MTTTNLPLVIGGKDVQTTETFDVVSPATGNLLFKTSSAGVAEAVAAVEAAAAAFPAWSGTHVHERRDILLKANHILQARSEEIKTTMKEETGSEAAWADLNVSLAEGQLAYAASLLASLEGRMPPVGDPNRQAMLVREPYGVVLSIVPWNAPLPLGFRAIVWALAAGNTIVFKGSELSPKTLWTVCSILWEAGVPPGALNFITSAPANAAAVTNAIIAHPKVRKINFTGSTAVGRIIARTAGENLKPVLLELGGKAPSIVLEDADLAVAAEQCVVGAFRNAGQICMSTERILVHESIKDAFAKEIAETAKAMYGQPGQEAPVLIVEAAVTKNKALVDDAVSKGAQVLYGDVAATENSKTRMRPIIISDVKPDMKVYKTESFGPTVSIIGFKTDEEALTVANDTEYGLSSAVFSKDLRRALAVAKRIETGAVHINSMTIHDEGSLPHGGAKDSGYGRFGGGFDEWTRSKIITFDA